jgi:hypothetical protein
MALYKPGDLRVLCKSFAPVALAALAVIVPRLSVASPMSSIQTVDTSDLTLPDTSVLSSDCGCGFSGDGIPLADGEMVVFQDGQTALRPAFPARCVRVQHPGHDPSPAEEPNPNPKI